MSTWYPQRFLVSKKHPINHEFRRLLKQVATAQARGEQAAGFETRTNGRP
jgi:hypothetical protein